MRTWPYACRKQKVVWPGSAPITITRIRIQYSGRLQPGVQGKTTHGKVSITNAITHAHLKRCNNVARTVPCYLAARRFSEPPMTQRPPINHINLAFEQSEYLAAFPLRILKTIPPTKFGWLAEWPETTKGRIIEYPTKQDIRRCGGIARSRRQNLILLVACLLFQPRVHAEFNVLLPGIEARLMRPGIFLADDHPALLKATTALLEPLFNMIGNATDGATLVSEVLPSARANCGRHYHAGFEWNRCRASTARVRLVSQNRVPDSALGTSVSRSVRGRGCNGICPQIPHEGSLNSGDTSGS